MVKTRGVLAVILLASASSFGDSPEALSAAVHVYRGLTFTAPPSGGIALDLYVPRGIEEPVPGIVVIPGGGFRAQQKEKFAKEAERLAEAGFAAVSIGYRGAPDETFPATVADCKAAVRFLRAHADEYGIDGERLGAFGQSAGGHLVQFLAVTGDDPAFEGAGGNPEVSSRIQAAVSFAGVSDFVGRLREGGSQPESTRTQKRRSNGLWIGEPFSPDSDTWKAASPITHLSADDAPILLVHGKKDGTVDFSQSVLMYEAMKPVQPETALLLLEDCGHGIRTSKVGGDEAWAATIAYFRQHLGGTTP